MSALLVALTIAACLSPLLTFAHLWQLKEWRIDRLREHLRTEGIFRPLFGILRPLIIIASLAIFYILYSIFYILAALILLTALNLLQIVLKKQKYPVWTQKAITLSTTSLLLTVATSFFIFHFSFFIALTLLPILQPFFLFLSWLLWFPVDRALKRHTLQEAQSLRAQYPDLTVIGITGSVGKTTTKELLAHILSDFHPLVTPAYVNTEMGVAQWLIKNLKGKMKNAKLLIVEMGAYKKGEIRTLCEIVQPTIGVITTIGTQHLGLFGSREAIAEAKGELFQALPRSGHAFIPDGTPFMKDIVQRATCNVRRVPADQRSSVALASAVARHLRISPEDIETRLRSFVPPPHTFSLRTQSGITILDDTHNVSPESFQAAIQWAASQPQEHKVLLTPGIIELGPEEDTIHKNLGRQASTVFDRVIFLHKRYAKTFEQGYGKSVELYSKNSSPVPQGSLLICIGRMSDTTISKLLS